jgi:hypothetical protein
MKNRGLLISLGVLGALALLARSSRSETSSAPSGPAPTPPPKDPSPAGDAPSSSDDEWFDWSRGKAVPDAPSFLSWAPTTPSSYQGGAPPAPRLPKAGELWSFVYSLNRPLSFVEMSVAKQSFAVALPDQTLESMKQDQGPPPTITITTKYLQNASEGAPESFKKSGVEARLISSTKVG